MVVEHLWCKMALQIGPRFAETMVLFFKELRLYESAFIIKTWALWFIQRCRSNGAGFQLWTSYRCLYVLIWSCWYFVTVSTLLNSSTNCTKIPIVPRWSHKGSSNLINSANSFSTEVLTGWCRSLVKWLFYCSNCL